MLSPATVLADQPRDFALDATPAGSRFILDYFGTGAQLTLQHNAPIYGKANEVVAGVNTLIGYPLAQASAFTCLRVLFLELGATLGYREVWRSLRFEKGIDSYCADCDRSARRASDPLLGKTPFTDRYAFAEGKLQLYAPLNDYVVFTSQLIARYEDSLPRSYDWFFTSIHDGGVSVRSENFLFLKHRDWGGIGPYVQVMSLPRADHHETEVAYGFNAVTRFGLVDRDDLLFLTFLVRPGDRYYGAHNYYAPIRALLIYRLMLAL